MGKPTNISEKTGKCTEQRFLVTSIMFLSDNSKRINRKLYTFIKYLYWQLLDEIKFSIILTLFKLFINI